MRLIRQKTVLLTALLSIAVLAAGGYSYMKYRAAGHGNCCGLDGHKTDGAACPVEEGMKGSDAKISGPALNEAQLSGKTETDCPYIQKSKKLIKLDPHEINTGGSK